MHRELFILSSHFKSVTAGHGRSCHEISLLLPCRICLPRHWSFASAYPSQCFPAYYPSRAQTRRSEYMPWYKAEYHPLRHSFNPFILEGHTALPSWATELNIQGSQVCTHVGFALPWVPDSLLSPLRGPHWRPRPIGAARLHSMPVPGRCFPSQRQPNCWVLCYRGHERRGRSFRIQPLLPTSFVHHAVCNVRGSM